MGTKGKDARLQQRLTSQARVLPSGCWEFLGGHANRAYRVLRWDGKAEGVHRLSYRAFVGDIPMGKVVMHLCDNPPCINPQHLALGSHGDNQSDKMRKGRWKGNGYERKTHCPQGHEYTPENVQWYRGRRICKACHYEHSKRHHRKEGYKERSKTHCIHGHLLDEANTLIRKDGGRQCKECAKRRRRDFAERKKG